MTNTTVPAMDPGMYRGKLTATGRSITEALAGIGPNDSLDALTVHLRDAEHLVGRAVTDLSSVQPPAAAAAQHADYVRALRVLDADLTEVQGAVSGHELCAAPAVLTRLHALRGARTLPAAAQALQDKGFGPAIRLPAAGRERHRRLANGTFARSGSRTGEGRLQIENNGSLDAVVSLVRRGKPAFGVYVRAGARFTVNRIDDGTYDAYFTTGADWDAGLGRFTRSCSFTRYQDTFPFRTTPTTAPGWSITLEQVAGGNARTSDVDPRNYPAG